MDITHLGPRQELETLLPEFFGKEPSHFPVDQICFLDCSKQEGEVKDPDHWENLAKTHTGKSGAVNLTYSHPFKDVEFVTNHGSGKYGETKLSLAFFPDTLVEFMHLFYPCRAIWRDRGKFYGVTRASFRVVNVKKRKKE